MTERIVSFHPNSITSEQVLTTTLGDIAVEAGQSLNLEQRINPFTQIVTTDGLVVNPDLDVKTDVLHYFGSETKRDRRETKAALTIREALLNKPNNTLAIWISPPYGKSTEGRITAGVITIGNDQRTLESYGIVTKLKPDHLLHIARQLGEFTIADNTLDKPDDLRSTALILPLPKESNCPWDFLSTYIPMPEVWESIISGEANAHKEEITKAAEQVAKETVSMVRSAKNTSEQIYAVSYAEQRMTNLGYGIDYSKLDCPSILTQTGINQTYVVLDQHGEVRQKEGGFVKECPHCGKGYDKWLPANFVCKGTLNNSCGKVYLGC